MKNRSPVDGTLVGIVVGKHLDSVLGEASSVVKTSVAGAVG